MATTHDRSIRPRVDAIIGLLIALGWIPALITLTRTSVLPATVWWDATVWLAFFFILLWATKIEGLSLASLGFRRPTVATFGWGLVAVATTFSLMAVYYLLIAPLFGVSSTPAVVDRISATSFYFIFWLSVSAGVTEELLYRFYAITQLHWLTGSKWVASLIPIAAFTAYHIPALGFGQLVPVALGAIVLTLLYWWRRDFWCNAFAHFAIDFSGFGMAALAQRAAGQ